MIDLKKLNKQIDELLEKETPETLSKWLSERSKNTKTSDKHETKQLNILGVRESFPISIYLNTGIDEDENIMFSELTEVSWSDTKINNKDVEYIRKDRVENYGKNQHYLGTQNKGLAEFDDWSSF